MKAAFGVLALAVACGPDDQNGNGNATGGAGGQGGAAGCVDVLITADLLPSPPNWFGRADGIPGGLGVSPKAVQIAWTARFRLANVTDLNGDDGTLELPLGVPEVRHTFAAWDGEAFAMHVYGAPLTFGLFVARVGDNGDIVLPLTEYGIASNVPPTIFSHRTSTNPESGRSYSADASGSAFLSGHLRDGTRLPGTESGAKVVKASGESTEVANTAAISADAAGAWVVWQQNIDAAETWGLKVQRVDLNGDATGAAGTIPIFPVDPEDGIWRWGLLSHGETATIIAASDPIPSTASTTTARPSRRRSASWAPETRIPSIRGTSR